MHTHTHFKNKNLNFKEYLKLYIYIYKGMLATNSQYPLVNSMNGT